MNKTYNEIKLKYKDDFKIIEDFINSEDFEQVEDFISTPYVQTINYLQQKIDKALEYIDRMTRVIDYDDDEFITWEHIIDIERILRGEENEK